MRRFTLILLIVLMVTLLTGAIVQVIVRPGLDRASRISPNPRISPSARTSPSPTAAFP